ncbi:UDP-glycosyltransferase 73C1 [Striga hermonthica]|uniref:UDP-glycosyltransferase 73C1 n=1 Tax=Striga hermonthica TaxID=68872 RepID=A0A9N7RGW5_STRHE|nr:UDP-glycosyltransferase 73C1 [Striga hermonthica]
MILMVDISRLLTKRGITVTILLSPKNHDRVKPTIERAVASGSCIRVSHFRFPSVEAGLPEGFESLEGILSLDVTVVATRLGIPTLVFHGTSCFAVVCMHLMKASNYFEDIAASDTEYFVLPELPDRIKITKAQIRGTAGKMPPE